MAQAESTSIYTKSTTINSTTNTVVLMPQD